MKKARMAKKEKANRRKAAGAKRTKVAQALKTKGITSDVTFAGTIEKTIPIDIEVGRDMGHPSRITKRGIRGKFQRQYKKITVISRRTDPHHKIRIKVHRLDKKVAASGNVSSSWISYLEWNPFAQTVTMGLIDGWNYVYRMPFKLFEGWYYAHSKGTYWHVRLRGKYYSNYIHKYWLP
jgi:hypothetical protein